MAQESSKNRPARQPNRPAAHQSPKRNVAERTPVSGTRDILTIKGADPSKSYRWVLDKSETGARIQRFLDAWYEFVSGDHAAQLKVGQNSVYQSDNVGSIIRRPAGDRSDEYLYLMCIDRELFEQDQKAKLEEVQQTEDSLLINIDKNSPDADTGIYGTTKLNQGFKVSRPTDGTAD